jgi:hypothetical protein
MIINCVVACRNAEGVSDFYFCKVDLPEEEYDIGTHYELAEDAALSEGYEGPMVTFDENDGPDWLFERFVWDSADIVAEGDEEDD